MCFEGLARLSRRVLRRFVRGSREISLVPSLHRASTDALINTTLYSIYCCHFYNVFLKNSSKQLFIRQLTVIIINYNLSGSSSSKAICCSNSQLETVDILSNIWSYLSNYCKTLFIFINIIINNSEELWYCDCV